MNGEHWSRPPAHHTECALSPNGKGSRSYHKCERRVRDSSYQFTERPNITTVYPDVADYTKSTSVTIVGEGFQPSSRATLRVGNDAVCGPGRNETCLTTAVTFVDSFTLVVVIPPHPQHWVAPQLGDGPSNFTIPVVLEVALNGQVMHAVMMKAPMDSTGMVVKESSCVRGMGGCGVGFMLRIEVCSDGENNVDRISPTTRECFISRCIALHSMPREIANEACVSAMILDDHNCDNGIGLALSHSVTRRWTHARTHARTRARARARTHTGM